MIVALDDEAGTPVVANPIRFDGADGDAASFARSAPPELGADTDAVLLDAGFSADEVAALHADGVRLTDQGARSGRSAARYRRRP